MHIYITSMQLNALIHFHISAFSHYLVGYDEIIVNCFISATSKGFSDYHYPIAFLKDHGITKQNSNTIIIYVIALQHFCNNTLSSGSLSRFSSGRARESSPGYNEIIVNLFISATSKGFSVYHYPIAFL